jgi:hypothetical protein
MKRMVNNMSWLCDETTCPHNDKGFCIATEDQPCIVDDYSE